MLEGYDFTSVAQAIDFMKHELSVGTDKELAAELGLDPSAVAAWRRRSKIPAKYKVRFYTTRDSYTAGTNHAAPAGTMREAYIFSLIGVAAERLRDRMGRRMDDDAFDVWLGFRLLKLSAHLQATFYRQLDDVDALRKDFIKVRDRLKADDVVMFVETLA